MWLLNLSWRIKLMLMFVTIGMAQEDTLQSALNAVHRRQRDLTEIPDYYPENRPGRYYYLPSDKDDLAFLKSDNRLNHYNDNRVFQKTLLDYLEDEKNRYPSQFSPIQDDSMKKRISSSFRERIENAKEIPDEDLPDSFNKLEDNDNEQYIDLLQQLPDKYRSYYPDSYKVHSINQLKKRTFSNDYYTNLGYDSIGMNKRSRYFEPDGPSESLYLLNYTPKDEMFERIHEEDLKSSDLVPEYYNNWNDYEQPESKRDKSYLQSLYSVNKRFPVTKRSNPPEHKFNGRKNQHKRINEASPKLSSTTDPKVAKELSSVFGSSNTQLTVNSKEKKSDNKNSTKLSQSKTAKQEVKNENKQNTALAKEPTTKEIVPNIIKEEPIQVKKKSINWRDYFGYDRKKKSDNNLDNEWLLERYHKAIAMAAKRNVDYPLQNFRYYDSDKTENFDKGNDKKSNIRGDEQTKLQEVDTKLKNIEDSIIDEALKYTGAHEGTVDSKEIQEVKDKVISRLAAAYSLEKMRQALGEYKESIAKQRKQMKEANQDKTKNEEKRVSVPRKHAIDEDREKAPEEDNNIKCAQGTEECNEQTYKTPKEILEEETQWIKGSCTKIQRACNEVADVLGNYGRTLEAACNMYQTCLLCGENTWFAPTRHCNVLFIAKSDELCDDDKECQKFARYSIRYLLDINRSLRADPLSECQLTCSDDRR